METSQERPRAGTPPDLTQPKEMLEYLLRVEIDRLEVARRIEKERDIVFPETTIIIRDIQKLMAAIGEDEQPPAPVAEEKPTRRRRPGADYE